MAFENGVNWRPCDPLARGRHATFSKALQAALSELITESNPFYDSIAEEWEKLFPKLPIKPGRYENGVIFLYTKSSSQFFMMRPKLKIIKEKLMSLPGAPEKLSLKLEIHSK